MRPVKITVFERSRLIGMDQVQLAEDCMMRGERFETDTGIDWYIDQVECDQDGVCLVRQWGFPAPGFV